MQWKKEGSTKGAKNKTHSYFLIKPYQTNHIHHQVHDHHHDDHDDQHEPRHAPICARDRGKAAVIPACPGAPPTHPLHCCCSSACVHPLQCTINYKYCCVLRCVRRGSPYFLTYIHQFNWYYQSSSVQFHLKSIRGWSIIDIAPQWLLLLSILDSRFKLRPNGIRLWRPTRTI